MAARRQVLRAQRAIEEGHYTREVRAEAYTNLGSYPTVSEARLVVAQGFVETAFAELEAERETAGAEGAEREEEAVDAYQPAIRYLEVELLRAPSDWLSKVMLASPPGGGHRGCEEGG